MQFTNHILSPNTYANKTHARTYNAPIHDSYMHAVPSPTRSSPLMQQKHHGRRRFGYLKSITISHVCMNIWLNNNAYVHTNNSPHHHHYLAYMHSPTLSPSINTYAFTNIDYIISFNNFIQFLTIQVKEKIYHAMINFIFNIYQPFKHLHIIIQSYSQKICKVFVLKDHFRQSSYHFTKRPIIALFKAKQLIQVWKPTIQS